MSNRRDDPRAGLTEQRLLRGWNTGAPGVKIRLATGADLPEVERLLPAADVTLTDQIVEAVGDGTIGHAHRVALAARGSQHGEPAFIRTLAEAFVTHGPSYVYLATALILVAEHRDHGVIGTVVAGPPWNVAEQCIAHVERDGGSEEDTQALVSLGAIAITKVAALAVAESARNQGIGAALLSRVKRVYFHHGYLYVYGRMPHRPGLPESYRRQGFEVKQPGEPLDLWVVFGIPVVVHSGPDHRLFVRGRPRTDQAST